MQETNRKPEYPVDKIFINRWSPRAMDGKGIGKDKLMQLFEAAKWAPSSYNGQPWRFIYAMRGTKHWDRLFGLMGEFNQSWTKNASALIVVVSKNTFDFNGKNAPTHSYDTGAAWENLALQGRMIGLVTHGMQGFDYEKAKKELKIPDGYTVEAMAAIGNPGKKEDLPKDLQEKEVPSDRKKINEIAFEGEFREAKQK